MSRDDEFSEFAAARWRPLGRSACYMGCDFQTAEDVAQATLIKCFTAWTKVKDADDRDAYASPILINTIGSKERSRVRRRWLLTSDVPQVAGSDLMESLGSTDLLGKSLARLSTEARQVVELRHIYGLSERQTAEALGLPSGTMKNGLSRALARLASDPQSLRSRERRGP
jgi:RNA polymerase sigma factor (sigma-70 family)